MSKYAEYVLNTLDYKLMKLAKSKDEMKLVSSRTDFTRNRKLSFIDLARLIIFMSSKPIKEELFDYFDYEKDTITSNAFVQARAKLLPKVFEELFYMMNNAFPCEETFKGYHLIAVDGSDINIPFDPTDSYTYYSRGENAKAFSLYHLNAAYDILNNRYIDMIINGCINEGEQRSMCSMVKRYNKGKAIFIGDRNYATWNVMENIIHANQLFLIRAKDIKRRTSLLNKFNLPDEEFDVDVEATLTTSQNKETKANPSKYRYLSTTSTFDFVDSTTTSYDVKYRVVRFRIDGAEEYESIMTNLDRDEFPASIIKELYGMRWSIETSFKCLKYSTNLSVIHAKKRNSILQEIWARAILYNISMTIIKHASKKLKRKSNKWEYVINITRAIHIIRNITKRKGGIPPDLEQIIIKELLPLRPGRSERRNVRNRHSVSFNYNLS